MLSKMASNTTEGGSASGGTGSGRRLPLSLSGGNSVSRLQQASGSNGNKKITDSFAPVKKATQQRTTTISTSSSSKSSQNGVGKSANGKEKAQNGSSPSKDQKSKDKLPERKKELGTQSVVAENKVQEVAENEDNDVVAETKKSVAQKENKEVPSENKEGQEETNEGATVENIRPSPQPGHPVPDEVIDIIPEVSTPTKDRQSTRKSGSPQKSPINKSIPASPSENKERESVPSTSASSLTPQEDVDMEPLQVNASPIRSVRGNLNAPPAATSTPGRSLFSKQASEVDLPSGSPARTPTRTFAEISGRRSIRPIDSLTPSRVGTYRSGNSDLDASSCTNASINATVGSEMLNSLSFSFSFFGHGRKRERTPPPLSASQSTNDVGQDVVMSPPKRARFDMFSLNLASPFSMLRSRFSRTTISSPARLRLDLNGSGVEGQQAREDVSSLPEELEVEEEQPTEDLIAGEEADVETPKEGGSPNKEIQPEKDVEGNNVDGQDVDRTSDGENIPPTVEVVDETQSEDRSRCSIM
ncbi:uncharacterized protein LOC108024362 [Drosophila biarmipes]|uniref:uncharacterized protein LOC108024362 n=1 Tax=Drosophila biarmipes TaxID=125945 RepID=UPI0007E639E7|nr:uncharacterized protein LOC108024362 [Drosophila biarmipes]XP_050744758.1 uncharacterized protein LOC108024362 [Drosophila biarmipes]